MTIHRFQRGETIRIIERALPDPASNVSVADISDVAGLPTMHLRSANAARTGPATNAPVAAVFETVFEPAAGEEPDRWVHTLQGGVGLPPGCYAANSQFVFTGGDTMKTPHCIILIEDSAT